MASVSSDRLSVFRSTNLRPLFFFQGVLCLLHRWCVVFPLVARWWPALSSVPSDGKHKSRLEEVSTAQIYYRSEFCSVVFPFFDVLCGGLCWELMGLHGQVSCRVTSPLGDYTDEEDERWWWVQHEISLSGAFVFIPVLAGGFGSESLQLWVRVRDVETVSTGLGPKLRFR